jgi:hypothetical protein
LIDDINPVRPWFPPPAATAPNLIPRILCLDPAI